MPPLSLMFFFLGVTSLRYSICFMFLAKILKRFNWDIGVASHLSRRSPVNGSKVVILVIFRSDPQTASTPVGIIFAFQDGKTFCNLRLSKHRSHDNLIITKGTTSKYLLSRAPKAAETYSKCKELNFDINNSLLNNDSINNFINSYWLMIQ